MILYQNKYRIESTRLKDWDYRRTGAYFITICTRNKQNIFGDIINDKIALNQIGKLIEYEWLKTIQKRKYIKLDEYIVMPNHFHCIVILFNEELEKEIFLNEINKAFCEEVNSTFINKNKYLKSKSISSIIVQFKSITTKRIRYKFMKDFYWQPRFYDHIIRTENELNKVRQYVHNNPLKWSLDQYYNDNK